MKHFFETESIKDEYDLIIIGAGPSGCSAAIYAARDELSTLVLEKFSPGGQVATTAEIENYPGITDAEGDRLADMFYQHAQSFGAVFRYGECTGIALDGDIKLVYLEGRPDPVKAKAVIIACGSTPRMLGISGESKFWGRGVGVCATCDGGFYKDKVVAAVGGGNAALEESVYLTRFADKVYLIHRRDEFRGSKIAQRMAEQNPKIEFILNSVVEEIVGDSKITGVKVKNLLNDELREISVDGVFMFIGQKPLSEPFKGLIDLNPEGFILASEDTCTNIPGIFAAGDIRTKEIRQVVTAVSDGAVAAKMAVKYIMESSFE